MNMNADKTQAIFRHLAVQVPVSSYRENVDLMNAAHALDSSIGFTLADLGRQMASLAKDLSRAAGRVDEATALGASVGTVNTLGVIQGQGSMIDGLCARLGAYMSQVPTLRTMLLQVPGAEALPR